MCFVRRSMLQLLSLFAMLVFVGGAASAYIPPEDEAGPLKARIEGPAEFSASHENPAYALILENAQPAAVTASVQLVLIDGWRAEPATFEALSIPGQSSQRLDFQLIPPALAHNAHYPLHAYVSFNHEGVRQTLHPILVLEVKDAEGIVLPPAFKWGAATVHPGQALPLGHLPVFRAAYSLFSGENVAMSPGWQGSEARTRADVRVRQSINASGDMREAISIHPPWANGQLGSALIEFPLYLPETTPIRLQFANAIRETHPNEPDSDGVTFRVRVAPLEAEPGALGELIFERHTASKRWLGGEADLTPYAGLPVRVQLESHPGRKHDPTCDGSYWAEPILLAGPVELNRTPVLGDPISLGVFTGAGLPCEVSLRLGERGLLDAKVSGVSGGRELFAFQGFQVRVAGDDLQSPLALSTLREVRQEKAGERVRVRHSFSTWYGDLDLMAEAWLDDGGFRTRFWLENTPPPKPWHALDIEEVSLGPWKQVLRSVYAGVGNVMKKPGAFTLGFDGHRLATSFVGYDFGAGVSMVQGVDAPPLRLDVGPENPALFAARRARTNDHAHSGGQRVGRRQSVARHQWLPSGRRRRPAGGPFRLRPMGRALRRKRRCPGKGLPLRTHRQCGRLAQLAALGV